MKIMSIIPMMTEIEPRLDYIFYGKLKVKKSGQQYGEDNCSTNKKNVAKMGDIFIKTFMGSPGLGNSKETVKSKTRRHIVYKCGKCDEEEEDIYDTYIRWGPHCKKCRKKLKADNQKVKPEAIKIVIERETKYKVVNINNGVIYLSCGEHLFESSWNKARDLGLKCPECNDNYKHPKLKIVKNLVQSEVETEELIIDVPEGYTVEHKDKKYWILKCVEGHILKCFNNESTECILDNIDWRSAAQSASLTDVTANINSKNAVLRSTYVNYKNLLQLECIICSTIFYKSYGNFIKKESVCPKCTNYRLMKEKELSNNNKLNNFKRHLESLEWKWIDTTTKYVDNRTKFLVMCPRDHIRVVCQDDFVNNTRNCALCANIARGEFHRLPLTDVNYICENSGFSFIGNNYMNMHTPILVQCLNPNCCKVLMLTLNTIRTGKCPVCHNFKSAGAMAVRRVLDCNEYVSEVSEEYTFTKEQDDWFACRDKKVLRYDFKVTLKNGTYFLIEYDGAQHFKAIELFGGNKAFVVRRNHDLIKSLYCAYNSIVLLRIADKDYKNITGIVNKMIDKILNKRLNDCILWYSNESHYESFLSDFESFEPPDNLN